jgi:hypothetical protein
LASSPQQSVPQNWRRPVKQRSRLVKRTGPAHARVEFAHPSEQEFARFLDYYRIRWVYEPVSFPIAWEGARVAEMFTPDFYLPEHDQYIELTTMKQSLVTPKNRKLRMLRELYPDLNVRLLYRKDYQQLLAKAGYGAVEVQNLRKQDIGAILISPVELETRVQALAKKISRDYRGQTLVVVAGSRSPSCWTTSRCGGTPARSPATAYASRATSTIRSPAVTCSWSRTS